MKYAKPAITLVDAAKSTIQGYIKWTGPFDNPPWYTTYILTVNAYEADE